MRQEYEKQRFQFLVQITRYYYYLLWNTLRYALNDTQPLPSCCISIKITSKFFRWAQFFLKGPHFASVASMKGVQFGMDLSPQWPQPFRTVDIRKKILQKSATRKWFADFLKYGMYVGFIGFEGTPMEFLFLISSRTNIF